MAKMPGSFDYRKFFGERQAWVDSYHRYDFPVTTYRLDEHGNRVLVAHGDQSKE